ncbi:MAG: DUF4398 domain-containing protein [Bryobacteraceae bacterium]
MIQKEFLPAMRPIPLVLVVLLANTFPLTPLSGQSNAAPPAVSPPHSDSVPIYRITVVQRALEAVNFERHGGPTEIDLKGTVLLPKAEGKATVEVKNGYTKIDLSIRHLSAPTQFGTEFLTYVLWAISPDGRATNLGEVIANGSDKAGMHITSPYSTFGLLITAEPYFSVPYPSDVVVMESAVRPDTVGRVEEVEAKYELLPRGQYTLNIKPAQLPSASMKNPGGVSMDEYEAIVALYQARNAMQIAKADGAERAAPETLGRAQQYLSQAEAAYAKKDLKNVTDEARQSVQAASDARSVAMRQKAAAKNP